MSGGDNFRGAEISGVPQEFDANHYSFFGDLDGAGALEGGLEEGLEAPPEEEVSRVDLPDEFDAKFTFDDTQLVVNEEEDLSLSSMLLNQSRLEQQKEKALQEMMRQPQVPESPGDGVDPFQGLIPLPADMDLELDQPESSSTYIFSSQPGSGLPSFPQPPVPPLSSKAAPMSAGELEKQLLGKADVSASPKPPSALIGGLAQGGGPQGPMGQHQQGLNLPGLHGLGGLPAPPPGPGQRPPSTVPGFAGRPPPGRMPPPPQQPNMGQGPSGAPPGPLPHMGEIPPMGMMPGHILPPGHFPQVMNHQSMMMPNFAPPGQDMPSRNFMGLPLPPHPRGFFPGGPGQPASPGYAMNRPSPPMPPGHFPNMSPPAHFPRGPPGPHPPQQGPYRSGPDAYGGRQMQPYMMHNQGPPPPHGAQAQPLVPDAYQKYQRQQNVQYDKQSGWVNGGQQQHQLNRQRVPGGLMMSTDEVEHIMSIMYSAVHTGLPYSEDYYYQAFVNLRKPESNAANFHPEVLRDLSEEVAKLDPSSSARFVPAEGLGKVVYSNIRTPRVLMDLSTGQEPAESSQDEDAEKAETKPLEQEPLLAARMMVEDCMNLLLDVDDIDRLFAAAAAKAGPKGTPRLPRAHPPKDLRIRRMMLLTGIAESFRLPRSPDGKPAKADAGQIRNDGVFMRIMALPKGRNMLARTLKLLEPPAVQATAVGVGPDGGDEPMPVWMDTPASDTTGAQDQRPAGFSNPASASDEVATTLQAPLYLLHAVLRSSLSIFTFNPVITGAPSTAASDQALVEKGFAEASSRLASAAVFALGKLHQPAHVVDCLTALVAGIEMHWQGVSKRMPSLQFPTDFLAVKDVSPVDILPLADVRPNKDTLPALSKLDWLGDVVVALVSRGEQLGLVSSASSMGAGHADVSPEQQGMWDAGVETLFAAIYRHLGALALLPATADIVPKLTFQPLLRVMAGQASDKERNEMRSRMQGLKK